LHIIEEDDTHLFESVEEPARTLILPEILQVAVPAIILADTILTCTDPVAG